MSCLRDLVLSSAALLLLSAMPLAVGAAQTPCPGDCNGDGVVTVDEVLTTVDLLLNGGLDACRAADALEINMIVVVDVVCALRNTLNGCGPCPP